MSAQIEWCVVQCMDGRLNEPIARELDRRKLPEKRDLISVAGGPSRFLERDATYSYDFEEVSLRLHGVRQVCLIEHTDCGHHGGRAACGETESADISYHREKLDKVIEMLREDHPELEILPLLLHIADDGAIRFLAD